MDGRALVVPTNVLLFRPEGTRIALVDAGGRVRLTPVKLGTDFGTEVEVLSGLNAGDQAHTESRRLARRRRRRDGARNHGQSLAAVRARAALILWWALDRPRPRGAPSAPIITGLPADVPPAWQPDAPWHEAAPSDGGLKGAWWELFQDDALNPLVERALSGNQNLRVAAARLDQARAQVSLAGADLYPTLDLTARRRPAAKTRRTVRSPRIQCRISPRRAKRFCDWAPR